MSSKACTRRAGVRNRRPAQAGRSASVRNDGSTKVAGMRSTKRCASTRKPASSTCSRMASRVGQWAGSPRSRDHPDAPPGSWLRACGFTSETSKPPPRRTNTRRNSAERPRSGPGTSGRPRWRRRRRSWPSRNGRSSGAAPGRASRRRAFVGGWPGLEHAARRSRQPTTRRRRGDRCRMRAWPGDRFRTPTSRMRRAPPRLQAFAARRRARAGTSGAAPAARRRSATRRRRTSGRGRGARPWPPA